MDWLNLLITIGIPIAICAFVVLYLLRMSKGLFKGVKFGGQKAFDPESVGDRLKKYLILAAKINPRKSKILKMSRTEYNEGGKFGRLKGVITGGDVTRFVFKRWIIGFSRVMYCPVYMHSSLHQREVFIHAVGIENNSGFYFPIPYKQKNLEAYTLTFDAFKKDLKKMERMDTQQIEVEQVVEAMIGQSATEYIIEAPEEVPVSDSGEGDFA